MTNFEAKTLPVFSVKRGKASRDGSISRAHDIRMSTAFRAWKFVKEENSGEFFSSEMQIKSKAEYLKFRDNLKSMINAMAEGQKLFKHDMSQPGGNPDAQWRKESAENIITSLIEIRRAGKVWSAAAAQDVEKQLAA
jgi:hypothetical protein